MKAKTKTKVIMTEASADQAQAAGVKAGKAVRAKANAAVMALAAGIGMVTGSVTGFAKGLWS